MCLHLFILIVLFLSLSCPAVVQAGDWVERSDAPYAGGYGVDTFHMFNWSDKSDLSTHIVINEIEQNPYGIDEGNEWVELYNPTTSDVNLDGWKLSTTHGKTVTVTLCGTIPANGYFVYTHTEQWLDNIGESVTLRDPSLNEVDRTPYVPDTNGTWYSWQRYPNGKDTDSNSDWEFRASTEGRSNGELPPQKTIYVDDDFVDDPPNHKWNTIQEGINDANSGDTIIVSDGTYNENVDVYKRLTIQSENGADVTIVQAASSSDHVFEVTADWVNITGFTVTGATDHGASPGLIISGIRLSYACYCNISNNNASNNYCGIYLYYSSDNTLTSNTASDNIYGIWLWDSSDNTLMSNTASDNKYGIHLCYSSDNTLMNNTASDNNYCGIYLYYCSSNNTITSNTASDNYKGIYIGYSSNNTLKNNTANSNTWHGIYLDYSSNNTLTSNTASNNKHGIYLYEWSNNTLMSNTASNNSIHGICLWDSSDNTLMSNTASDNEYGIYLYESSNNTLKNNTANSNPWYGIYLDHSSNNNITSNTASDNNYGIALWDSSNNTLMSNTASDNYNGIYLWDSSNNTLTSNTASDNHYGICLRYSSNNTIPSNTASNNSVHGIALWDSSNNNTLMNNTASDNKYGIYMGHSSNNTIYHNNLINNTNSNAYDDGNNTWDNDYQSGGNYYSDYDGTDNNTDGIGDTPYLIPIDGVDYFPLMQPWSEDTQQKGDLNGDDRITAADAAIALRMAVSGERDDNADMDGDGQVSSVDALMILQAATGSAEGTF